MPHYTLTLRMEDAHGGSWNETRSLDLPTMLDAENAAVDAALEWMQDGEPPGQLVASDVNIEIESSEDSEPGRWVDVTGTLDSPDITVS